MQKLFIMRLTQRNRSIILHRNIFEECCPQILLWWFFAEAANLTRLFVALRKNLTQRSKPLTFYPDIIRMLFFSTPSFGGSLPGSLTPAFLCSRWWVRHWELSGRKGSDKQAK